MSNLDNTNYEVDLSDGVITFKKYQYYTWFC